MPTRSVIVSWAAKATMLVNLPSSFPRTKDTNVNFQDTVTYIYNTLTALDYYDVTLQPWTSYVQQSGDFSLAIDGENITNAILFDYSASGDVSAPIVPVANLGCDQVRSLLENFGPNQLTSNLVGLPSRG